MSPYEEAQQRANEIAAAGFAGMLVTMSWGGEYTDSVDVNAQLSPQQQVQAKLNELGFGPLKVDGQIGPATCAAILAALAKIGASA